jgi:hypothetical protein
MSEVIQENDIETILEDLSYAFASPESADFMRLLGEKNYTKAKKMLLKKIDPDSATLVIKHFKALAKSKFSLVEVTYEEFKNKHPYTNSISDVQIVINYRAGIVSGVLSRTYFGENEWSIFIGSNQVLIKDADQIWCVENKKVI